jgi:hypothetical protein
MSSRRISSALNGRWFSGAPPGEHRRVIDALPRTLVDDPAVDRRNSKAVHWFGHNGIKMRASAPDGEIATSC